eukprot:gene12711-16937_t
MVPQLRSAFNASFTAEQYQAYLDDLNSYHPGDIVFRVAETPIFVGKDFTDKILTACESIVDVIVQPDFMALTADAIPDNVRVPGETPYSDFIAFDFGICIDENGNYTPQLIEMQGFPTLFAYQILHDEITRKHFDVPESFKSYLGGFNKENYVSERVFVTVRDGAKVPVSIVYQKDTKLDGTAPLLQYSYGSYGYSTDATFGSSRLSLLDRGFVYAIAHIRGGQEMGRE